MQSLFLCQITFCSHHFLHHPLTSFLFLPLLLFHRSHLSFECLNCTLHTRLVESNPLILTLQRRQFGISFLFLFTPSPLCLLKRTSFRSQLCGDRVQRNRKEMPNWRR